jgi:hypothetical protein
VIQCLRCLFSQIEYLEGTAPLCRKDAFHPPNETIAIDTLIHVEMNGVALGMSAFLDWSGYVRFGSKADMCGATRGVCYGPKADIGHKV